MLTRSSDRVADGDGVAAGGPVSDGARTGRKPEPTRSSCISGDGDAAVSRNVLLKFLASARRTA